MDIEKNFNTWKVLKFKMCGLNLAIDNLLNSNFWDKKFLDLLFLSWQIDYCIVLELVSQEIWSEFIASFV